MTGTGKRWFGPGLLIASLLTGCGAEDDCVLQNAGMQTMHQEGLTLFDDNGKTRHVQSLIADDQVERASGFQHVCPEVIRETKILFVYSQPVYSSFHMSNVKAPLDIGFFDAQGLLVSVMRMHVYARDQRPLYSPGRPFQYALETPVGFFEDAMLSPGRSRLLLRSF